jgi:small nuclear ribonucleoprotein (snRNP)-like protein
MKLKTNHRILSCTLLFAFGLLHMGEVNAQHDSLILKNGNTIVGEIKSLDKGVLTIETDYSKSDFTIEWSGIREIYSRSSFLVTLTDGRRFNGTIQSVDGGKKVNITDVSGQTVESSVNDIVFLKGLKSDFWSRMRANVDIGLSFSKANHLNQLTINSNVGYLADKWEVAVYYDMTSSSQDSVETTKRTDAGVSFKYYLQRDWFLATSLSFLSNTEQALKLRTTGKLGAGKFFKHTNQTYWAGVAGLSLNNESFNEGTESRNSLEAYVGSELNMFDVGDLNLISSLYVYPSLTESGRLRTDFRFDAKYDLPLDFYIKLGLTLNYDNKPAVAGKETDYVLGFSIGWEL